MVIKSNRIRENNYILTRARQILIFAYLQVYFSQARKHVKSLRRNLIVDGPCWRSVERYCSGKFPITTHIRPPCHPFRYRALLQQGQVTSSYVRALFIVIAETHFSACIRLRREYTRRKLNVRDVQQLD